MNERWNQFECEINEWINLSPLSSLIFREFPFLGAEQMRNFDYFNIFGKRVTINFLVFVSWRSLVLKPRFFEQMFVYRVSEQILSPQMKFGATQTIKGPKPRVIPFLERHSPYWPGRWKGSRSIISEKDVTSSRGALELSYDPSLPLESIDLSRSRSLAAEKRTYRAPE